MISLEALPKVVDSSQLTPDLDGTLQYDHPQWIDLRLVSICQINNGRLNMVFLNDL